MHDILGFLHVFSPPVSNDRVCGGFTFSINRSFFVYIHPLNVYKVGGFVYIGGLCPARNCEGSAS